MPHHIEGGANLLTDMNIPNDQEPAGAPLMTAGAPPAPTEVTPVEFFRFMAVGSPDTDQVIVTAGPAGTPNDHTAIKGGDDCAERMAARSKGRKPGYFAPAGFKAGTVSRFKGRAAENASLVRAFWFDIEGSAEKYAKPNGPDGGYPDQAAVLKALTIFVKATALYPNLLVQTGSGGVHPYFVLNKPIPPAEWIGRAKALVQLAGKCMLKVDAQCTTDAARIMRAPGSIHQKTEQPVRAIRWRRDPYTLEEFDALAKYRPDAVIVPGAAQGSASGLAPRDINDDVLTSGQTAYSYTLAATKCAAMQLAAEHHGRDTPYAVWILAAKTADLSTEGRRMAHDISSGHPEYDEASTDKKISSLTGGPAGCGAWANAYGPGGPCESCEFRGQLKNPAIQLGAMVDTTPPGAVATTSTTIDAQPVAPVAPDWVEHLNARFALVRIGAKMVVVDFQTPSMSGRGVRRGYGVLDTTAFRRMFAGRFAPITKSGEKQRPLADAWLDHTARRQYEGVVFAPGESTPPTILNLWQGFALPPAGGDVSLWLEVLEALIPIESDRRYVLRWIAWKVQHPGGVPDTILIFKGAKGTGKNSLFDPLIMLFGMHAMLADDPELIAGRFTWHLMSLAFAVLDEAVFVGDPRQADRIKSRVTAKTMMYEQKGMDPVQGVNRCGFVMLTNHGHVWQATADERRAVVIECGDSLRGQHDFWSRYHQWVEGDGPAALLHHLQGIDLTGFNPRVIPRGEALRQQIERTALRDPAIVWWHTCLTEGAIRWHEDSPRVIQLNEDTATEVARTSLRLSYERSAGSRGRDDAMWPQVQKRINSWAGGRVGKVRRTWQGVPNVWVDVFPPLAELRAAFTAFTQVQVGE